jgi:peroxiredoxin
MYFSNRLLLAAVATTFALSGFCESSPAAKASADTNITAQKAESVKAAPNFTLKDTEGKSHSLSDYKGKIVVLEWTNPGCPFVQRHLKAQTTNNLEKKYDGKDVVFLKIDSTKSVTPESENKSIEESKVGQPVLLDADGTVAREYGAKTTPHVFVIDKSGKIAYNGAYDDDPQGEKGQNALNYVDDALAKITSGGQPKIAHTTSYGCSVKYKS